MMSKHVVKNLFQAVILCMGVTLPAAGQTQEVSSPDVLTFVPGVQPAELEVSTGEGVEPGSAFAVAAPLLKCKGDLSAAVDQMLAMRGNLERQVMQLQSEKSQCQAEIRDRASGAAELLRRAEVAEARVRELDGKTITDEERATDAAKIRELEARIERLLKRLDILGVSEVPQFSYLQDDPSGSLLNPQKLADLSLDGAVVSEDCGKALGWLRDRSGDDSPFRVAAWTYSKVGGWQLCRLSNATSEAETIDPVGSDKAHMLYFR